MLERYVKLKSKEGKPIPTELFVDYESKYVPEKNTNCDFVVGVVIVFAGVILGLSLYIMYSLC